MTVAEQHLLVDTTNLAILLLGVSFMFRRLAASRNMFLSSESYGKVFTHFFGLPELALALAIVSLLYATVRYPSLRDYEGHPALTFLVQNGLLILVLIVLLVTCILRKHDLVELFGLDRLQGKPLLIWASAGFVVITLCTFLSMWVWQLWIRDLLGPASPQESIRNLRDNPNVLIPTFITAVMVGPFVEEILFRGFLYPTLKRYSQSLVALVVTAGIFAAIHLHLPSLFPLFVLSCLLTAAYELSGSLWVPILVHSAFNALNIFITVSGLFSHAN